MLKFIDSCRKMMGKGGLMLGILLLAGAAFLWTEVDNLSPQHKRSVATCNQGWGDIMGSAGMIACIKMQSVYYSPWIVGIIGIVAIVRSFY